jgi:hypothetical protein
MPITDIEERKYKAKETHTYSSLCIVYQQLLEWLSSAEDSDDKMIFALIAMAFY